MGPINLNQQQQPVCRISIVIIIIPPLGFLSFLSLRLFSSYLEFHLMGRRRSEIVDQSNRKSVRFVIC